MARAHREVELKLEVPPAGIKRLKRHLRRHPAVKAPPRTDDLTSVYFDTKGLRLRREGFSLRVRDTGARRVQTVKRSGNGSAGLFDRGEWEHAVDGRSPDWRAAKRTPLKRLLTKKLRAAARPLFESRIRRTSYRVRGRGGDLTLALDEGSIDAGSRSAPVSEIELEVEGGDPAAAFRFAQSLAALAPLTLAGKSKSERGYDLVTGAAPRAVEAARVPLTADMDAGRAFRAVAREGLRHLVANRPALARGDAEGLHQMRVALRRLRAALSIFSDVVADGGIGHVKRELKWLTRELAPARDLDVFLSEMPTPPRRFAEDGGDGVYRDLAGRQARAHARAETAVASPRVRKLLLDLARWIEAGPWTTAKGAQAKRRAQPIAKYAADELSRRRKTVEKRSRRIDRLDPRKRHKLRIAVKKLRYAAEFFAGLFDGKRAHKRRKAFLAVLKRLQSALRGLNDIATRERLGAAVARSSGPRAKRAGPQRAFAAGWITATEEARAAPLLGAAAKAAAALRKTGPPWA
jgi:triphosphatase